VDVTLAGASHLTGGGEVLLALVMLVGLVGVLLPVLPGLALIEVAGLAWVWLDGGGVARWTVFALMSAAVLAGTVAKYALPARSAHAEGAPRSTMLLGVVGATVGFFVIPVLGLVVGGLAGVYLAELSRLGDRSLAWRSTRAVLRAVGIGVLIELTAGVAAILVWLLGVLLI